MCKDADGGDCAPEVNGGVDGCSFSRPFCGDGICNGDETELSCPEDCASSADCEACDLDLLHTVLSAVTQHGLNLV